MLTAISPAQKRLTYKMSDFIKHLSNQGEKKVEKQCFEGSPFNVSKARLETAINK